MNELVAQYTHLPNLHPALVHFPIALIACAFLVDLAAVAVRRASWLDRAGALLWAGAALATILTYRSGLAAADAIGLASPAVEHVLGEHANLAWFTFLAVVPVALLRAALAWRERASERVGVDAARLALLALSVVPLGLVVAAADHGGELVYEHGVHVAAAARPAPGAGLADGPLGETVRRERPAAELRRGEDGSVTWTPGSQGAGLPEGLTPITVQRASLTVAPPAGAGAEGLRLMVRGRGFLLLPGEHEGMQVEARIDASAFTGDLALVHHFVDPGTHGAFRIAEGGETILEQLGDGSTRVLDRAEGGLPGGEVMLSASSSGSHRRGHVNGETVVHGHAPSPPPGRAGLLLDGEGSARVLSLTVRPVEDH